MFFSLIHYVLTQGFADRGNFIVLMIAQYGFQMRKFELVGDQLQQIDGLLRRQL